MKSTIPFLLIIIIFHSAGYTQAQHGQLIRSIPLSKHFDSHEYEGGIQNWALDQDRSGILYAANNAGLLEFDGNKWTLFDVPYCTKVRAVHIDEMDRIFIGGQGQIGYFSKTEKGLVFTSLLHKLPPQCRDIAETWKILELDDKIIFNTESQLIVMQQDSLYALELPGYIHRAFVVGEKLMAQLNNVLYVYDSDGFTPVEGPERMNGIISIVTKQEGHLLFADDGLVFEYRGGEILPASIAVDLGTTNIAIRLHSGDYCVGTQYNGLFILDETLSLKQHFTKNEGVSNRTILSMHEDQFNNLWIATNNGIDYLEMDLPFSLVNEDVGLEGTGYAARMFEDQIFLGTNNGLFVQRIDQNGIKNKRFELFPGSYGQVYNLSRIGDQLILGHHRGAFQLKDQQLYKFHDMGSWKFIPTRLPGLILGGDYQGITYFQKRKDTYERIGRVEGFYESSRVMEYENDSVLWMTHGSKGTFRLVFNDSMQVMGEIRQYGIKNGFPSNDINVFSINDQLVFTAEDGIYNFNQESSSFNPNQFFNKWLGNKQVVSMASNGNNAIYYIQDKQMGMLIQESFGTYRIETDLFKHINKFLNDDLPNISIIDEENILIGAKEGFIKFNPEKRFSSNNDFHVLLRSIEIQPLQDSSTFFDPTFLKNFQLNKNQSVKFHYAAPYFDGFEDIRYSFRLLPVDENWSKWTSSGEKEYSFLSPGEYSLEIKALNVYGEESPVTSFAFKVIKPWYASNPAIVAYFLIGISSIVLILLIQQRRYHLEKSIIHQDKEKALQQKNEEINQISQRSKKEIDILMNERLRTEINLKNDQLTTFTMHFMNSNEFIRDSLKKIESNLNDGGSQEELREIIRTIDKNLTNNDSWEKFAYHFDQVHGDYLKKLSDNNIRLSPREIKLAAFLRMNLSSKDISTMLNITERGVELARYRLRKKLNLERDQNLVEYLIELDNK